MYSYDRCASNIPIEAYKQGFDEAQANEPRRTSPTWAKELGRAQKALADFTSQLKRQIGDAEKGVGRGGRNGAPGRLGGVTAAFRNFSWAHGYIDGLYAAPH